jgi:fido (protein-threonine AMPylation protein)
MPHRAGYFVLAYAWDHHCQVLFESLERRFRLVERDVSELGRDGSTNAEALLRYYKKWHHANELLRLTMAETKSRQYVINSLGYRGYGVNRDLLAALGDLEGRYRGLEGSLMERFYWKIEALKEKVPLDSEAIDRRRAEVIISGLARRMGRDDGEIPQAREETFVDFDHYFRVMSKETLWDINTAIFQKMFFSAGLSSMTIMRGSTGLHSGRSCQEMKVAANRNFVDTGRELFSTLHTFTEIGIDFLKRIHYWLSRDLHADAGNFRSIDFPDRNGVTFEFENFQREISDLAIVLAETARSFHNLHEFIYNLARSYYMFIGIHPFWDANGRAGRCFLNFLLVKKGLPPVMPDDREEVLALPRYGGSMDDMHRYLLGRLRRAIEVYFYERGKLDSFGLSGKSVRNTAFDSGFHFRQIGSGRPRIGVNFEAYVCDDPSLREALAEQSKIVFPDARLLAGMDIYCGFCDAPFTEWRRAFSVRENFYIKELPEEPDGVRRFDIDFIVDAPQPGEGGEYFACSVTSNEGHLIFNNKGLNYSYRLYREEA